MKFLKGVMYTLREAQQLKGKGFLYALALFLAIALILTQFAAILVLFTVMPAAIGLTLAKVFVVVTALFVWMYLAFLGTISLDSNPFSLADHWLDVMYINDAENMFMSTMNYLF